jgi:hypothetical protein
MDAVRCTSISGLGDRANEAGFGFRCMALPKRRAGGMLAVDVLVIGEHGGYPVNDKGKFNICTEFREQSSRCSKPTATTCRWRQTYPQPRESRQNGRGQQAAGLSDAGRLKSARFVAIAPVSAAGCARGAL